MAARDRSPWMGTATFTTAGTRQRLSALILATTNPPLTPTPSPAPLVAEYLSIQLDMGAGGARLFIGNDDVSATNRGYELVAGASNPPFTVPGNHITLNDIWVDSDTNSVKVNITFIAG